MFAYTRFVLLGSVVVFFILFLIIQDKRRAALACFMGAWLFLPVVPAKTYEIIGLPDISKLFITGFGIFLAVLLFDFKRVKSFRPHWVDLPMLLWCLVPIASSVSNCLLEGFGGNCFNPLSNISTEVLGYNLGMYDGLSEALGQIVKWGLPYFIGRLYFFDWDGLKELALGSIISLIVYSPLMIFEMRMSPQLHKFLYGDHQHLFLQTERFGGYRPMVFMNHGLMLAFWVMAVTLLTVWMWRAGTIKKLGPVPIIAILIFFVLLTIFMRSVNGWVWLALGTITLFATEKLRTPWVILALMLIVPFYTFTEGVSIWPTEVSVDFMTGLIGPERAQSLEFRYFNEEFLTAKARQQWLFGWAGWDRQLVTFEWSNARTVPDALWILTFGKFGLTGLVSLIAVLFLPLLLLLVKYPPWLWAHPKVAPAAALGIILLLYMFDGLLNAMINPIFMLAAGGLTGLYVRVPVAMPALSSQTEPVQPLPAT